MKDKPKKAPRREREEQERRLDEAIEGSFPASDPLPTTGTSAGAPDDRPATAPHGRAHKKEPPNPKGQSGRP